MMHHQHEQNRKWCEHDEHESVERFVACCALGVHLHLNRIERLIMTTQVDVDALTTSVSDLNTKVSDAVATLTADDSAIQAEIEALKAANPALDLTGLQAAVTDAADKVTALQGAVDATSALVPAPEAGGAGEPVSTEG